MRVQLIDYTGAETRDPARYAAAILIFTKSTRLEMCPSLLHEIMTWPSDKLRAELEYMAKTIPSSWEFVSYTFLMSDVTRAFTHQLVRTRTGSYAQQTMRVLNVSGWEFATGPSIQDDDGLRNVYVEAMDNISLAYDELIRRGAKVEDARGVLPTNILTNIVAKFDLRTVCGLARSRKSSRTQVEYRAVLDAMLAEVLRVHPWAELFLERGAALAIEELEDLCRTKLPEDDRTTAVKLLDEVRNA